MRGLLLGADAAPSSPIYLSSSENEASTGETKKATLG